MIYPDLRISELAEQTRDSKEKFLRQSETTISAVRDQFSPSNLLSHHKGAVIGTAVSSLLLGKLGFSALRWIVPKLKGTYVWTLIQAGWMWKAMQLSVQIYKLAFKK